MERERHRSPDDFSIEPLEIVDPVSFQDVPVPIRRWLWDSWVPLGVVTALYGDGGTGKSLLAQQLMTSCAAHRTFLGFDVMRCRALGIFCEDDRDELHRRQAAINETTGVDFADLMDVRWVPRVGLENLLMLFGADGRGVPTPFFFQLLDLAKSVGSQLIIIDTAADTFAGNENIRPQVRQFLGLLTRLAREIEGAVILLAHPSQTGRATGQGDGGSTAWNNSVRSRLYLSRLEATNGDAPDPNIRILSRRKANYALAGVDITLRWSGGAFALVGSPDQADAGQSVYRQAQAEEAFMTGMGELKEKNLRCNVHKGQANYAPKALREMTTICASFSENELAAAMHRLIKMGQLKSIEEGPPSRRRSFLVVMAPILPGV
jgi:RecA-family ATPase